MVPIQNIALEIALSGFIISFLRSSNNRVAIQTTLFSMIYAVFEIFLNQTNFFLYSNNMAYHILYYLIFGMYAFSQIHPLKDVRSTVINLINLILYMSLLEDIFYWLFSLSDPVSYFLYPVIYGIPIDEFIILCVLIFIRVKWKSLIS